MLFLQAHWNLSV